MSACFNTFTYIHLADAFQGDLEIMTRVINHTQPRTLAVLQFVFTEEVCFQLSIDR